MAERTADCVAPGEIEAEALIAYAQGEASPTVTQHLNHCPACRSEADSYASLSSLLESRLFRQSCPPSLTIGEYAADLLPPEERLAIAQHLAECPHCRAERREFSDFLSEPDEPLAAPGLAGALRRIFARRLDPLVPALSGLRGNASGESVSYDADGLGVTISVQRGGRAPHGGVIVGLLQLGPEALAGSRAELLAGGSLLQSQDVDDLGNFLFGDVSPGRYRIEVTVPDALIVLDPVDVT